MRDVVLSSAAGFLAASAGGFVLHRSLWKMADKHAQQIEAISGPTAEQAVRSRSRTSDTFETQIAKRVVAWWNKGVDNVHMRLLYLPDTLRGIVKDVLSTTDDKSDGEEKSA